VATLRDLERVLHRIDRRGYRAYREVKGRWAGLPARELPAARGRRGSASRGVGASDGLDPSPELAIPRSFELAAAINRLRGLEID